MAPADLAQQFTAAVTRALTAGGTMAFTRMMLGEPGLAPESIREGVMAAFGTFDPKIKGRSILTPRARASVGDALSVLSFNIGAAMAGKEPA